QLHTQSYSYSRHHLLQNVLVLLKTAHPSDRPLNANFAPPISLAPISSFKNRQLPPTIMQLMNLPDELLGSILSYISPDEVLFNAQLACKRLRAACGEPLLWKHHCQTDFKYWDPKHRIQQKLRGNVNDVDWKKLYVYRRWMDLQITQVLDSILDGQVDRIRKYGKIAEFGYDAKDTLLRHCRTDDSAEDVLARRYYANSVLDHLHRSQALAVWHEVINGHSVSLERALGSFDLFVLGDKFGDLLEISQLLDDWAARFKKECPNYRELTMRKKALLLTRFVRMHNLTGCGSDEAYRDLQNCFIGIVLQDDNHPSLPLLTVAIFCCIATRLGIDARPCGVPLHVHAMVFPSKTETLDGRDVLKDGTTGGPMYLDPFRSDHEVDKEDLHRMLGSFGVDAHEYGRYIAEAEPTNLILRTSRNILSSVQQYRALHGNSDDNSRFVLYRNPYTDTENSFYAALWANFIFGRPSSAMDTSNQRKFIPLILERYERLFPMDSDLVERYICPLFTSTWNQEYRELQEALRVVRAADYTPKQVRRRDNQALEGVKYHVGQIFRHRRYAYEAVIIGWDIECGMNPDWIATNGVDWLSRGRHQSFYHVL
ncbi:hypothetical protein HYALB_00001320, partial [Hymenoscyphus albidus]